MTAYTAVKLERYGIGREFMVFSRHIRRKPGLPLCRHGARMCLISVIMTRSPKSADLTALEGYCRDVSRRVSVLTRTRFEPFNLNLSTSFTFYHLKVLHLRIKECICCDHTKKCIFFDNTCEYLRPTTVVHPMETANAV